MTGGKDGKILILEKYMMGKFNFSRKISEFLPLVMNFLAKNANEVFKKWSGFSSGCLFSAF